MPETHLALWGTKNLAKTRKTKCVSDNKTIIITVSSWNIEILYLRHEFSIIVTRKERE